MKPRAIKGVQVLKAYHPPLSGRDDYLRLDFNEWLGSAHPALQKVLDSFDVAKLNMYPEGEAAMKAVAQQFGVGVENLQLSNGVDEAFCNVFRTYLDKGDKILLPEPGYAMMEFYATLCEAEVVKWELEVADNFAYNIDKAEAFLKAGGKCLALGQPNNPTGSMLAVEQVKKFCEAWPDRLFVVDEAYIEFAGDSMASEVKNYSNLIVFRTFSKAWSLAGLRLGAVMASKEITTELKKMWSPYSVNVLGLSMLAAMLPDQKWVEDLKNIVASQRDRLKVELGQRGIQANFGGGNFFLLNVGDNIVDFIKAFEDNGIRLRDHNSKYGLKGWLRVSIGPSDITDQFLSTLDKVLESVPVKESTK